MHKVILTIGIHCAVFCIPGRLWSLQEVLHTGQTVVTSGGSTYRADCGHFRRFCVPQNRFGRCREEKTTNSISSDYNSNKLPTRCNNFPVYYPDIYLQLNKFWAFFRPSSEAQWLQWQPLVLPSYLGDSRVVFGVGPASRPDHLRQVQSLFQSELST
jgi:hypothetical protein